MQKLTFHFQNAQRIIQQIGLIDEFKGKWASKKLHLSADHLNHLHITVSNENTAASMQLEKVLNPVDEYAKVYKNALNIVLNPTTLFTHQMLEYLYAELEPQQTQVDFKKYRNSTPKLVLTLQDQSISFRSTPTQNIVAQLKQEIQKTTVFMERKSVHPLIAIADFMYEFAALAPFETHNLQVSRFIAIQLLKQSNYDFIEYLTLEAFFLERKTLYQQTLAKALQSRNQAKEDISDWIVFLLDCILLSINHLEKEIISFNLETVRQNSTAQSSSGIANSIKNPIIETKSSIVKMGKPPIEKIVTSNLFNESEPQKIDNQFVESEKEIVKKDATAVLKIVKPAKLDMKTEERAPTSDVYLSPRQKKLKKFILEKQPVRLNDLKIAFPEINQHIMRKDLQYMHRLNEIQKIGDYKNTVYTVVP